MDEERLRKILPEGAKTYEEARAEMQEKMKARNEHRKDLKARGPLTVARLRALLDEFDDDLVIVAEGCDCLGDAYQVEERNGTLEIQRLS